MKSHLPAAVAPDDDLLKLEIHVARRADVLAQGSASDRGADLAHWLQAECEVLGQRLPVAWAHR
jgi:hypothetical protein